MEIFTILMFILAFAFLIPAILLYLGECSWLRSFDKAKYKNKKEYAKFLGKCILYFSIAFCLSGLASLLISELLSVIILIIEIIIIIVIISKKSKKLYK